MSFSNFNFDEVLPTASSPDLQQVGSQQSLSLIKKLLQPTAFSKNEDAIEQLNQSIDQLLPKLGLFDPNIWQQQTLSSMAKAVVERSYNPSLHYKTVIGFGGGFSAGKSRFINTLLGVDLLPEALEPCTAIATYIMPSLQNQIQALNLFNQQVQLDDQELRSLSHLFDSDASSSGTASSEVIKKEPINLGQLIQHIVIEQSSLPDSHLVFLDTPGYSKADSQHHQHSDEQLALNQLNQVDHLVWLVSAKNGTIREEDLQFIQSLALPQPIFFVVTQSDLVNRSELDSILAGIKQTLQRRGVAIAGLTAWAAPISSNKGRQLAGDNILSWLESVNLPRAEHMRNELVHQLSQHYRHAQQQLELDKQELSLLNQVYLNISSLGVNQKKQLEQYHADKRNQVQTKTAVLQQVAELNQQIKQLVIHLIPKDGDKEIILLEESDEDAKYLLDEESTDDEEHCFDLAKKFNLLNGTAAEQKQAFEYCLRAAKLGHVEAQYYVGCGFESGLGVGLNESKAIKWHRKAAEQGHADAQNKISEINKVQFNQGKAYEFGEGVLKNIHQAKDCYRKAAELGHAESQNKLGLLSDDKSESLKWYSKAAEQGNASAQSHLGYIYANGIGVKKSSSIAFTWFHKSANQGDAKAQYNLGRMYYYGIDGSLSHKEAANWYKKSAEQGYANAQYSLGLMLINGFGGSQNRIEAVKLLSKAAEQGHADAKENLKSLGYIAQAHVAEEKKLDSVVLGSQNFDNIYLTAVFRAANQGDAVAQNKLGRAYCSGEGIIENQSEAIKWYRKAAKQGHADAQYSLGQAYYYGRGVSQNYEAAVDWFRKAAQQNHADAQNNLGGAYYLGEGVSEDQSHAVKWYRKAAEQGQADAQNSLGEAYYYGQGVIQNYVAAVDWFRKAAEQNHADAQNSLGVAYELGEGIIEDQSEAVKWYRKAAEQDHAYAQHNLGVAYELGQGVGQNLTEAIKWYRKAAEQGHESAQENLKRLEEAAQSHAEVKDKLDSAGLSSKNLTIAEIRRAAEHGDAEAQNKLGGMYENGQGVSKYHTEAVKWYRRAALQRHVDAGKNLKRLGYKA